VWVQLPPSKNEREAERRKTRLECGTDAPWSCDVAIADVAIADLARAGLQASSVIRTAKIACIDPARIERRAGRLDKATAKATAQKRRGFLGGIKLR